MGKKSLSANSESDPLHRTVTGPRKIMPKSETFSRCFPRAFYAIIWGGGIEIEGSSTQLAA